MSQPHSLMWGDIRLAGDVVDPDAEYVIETVADGTVLGTAKALIEFVKSLQVDGSLAVMNGHDNAETVLQLKVSAPDGTAAGPAVAKAAAALAANASADPIPPLVWDSPLDGAATCVYDVYAADPVRDERGDWDLDEEMRERRHFTVTMSRHPFARPANPVVVPAATYTPVLVDDCNGLGANWFIDPLTNATVTGGYIQVQKFSGVAAGVTRMNLVVGDRPYYRVTATIIDGDALRFSAGNSTGGARPTLLFKTPSATAGATDYYLSIPTNLTDLSMTFTRAASGTITGRLYNIDSFDAVPSVGSARQQARVATIPGSAPTQAAIRIYDPTPGALGTDILGYTTPYSAIPPSLRPFSTITGTTDAAMISGARNTLASPTVFRIPANQLVKGMHALIGRLNVTTAGTLTWASRIVDSSGNATVGSGLIDSGSVEVPVTSGYRFINLAAMLLPPVEVEGTQLVEITISGTANMTWDDFELFNITEGSLTWIRDADNLSWVEIRPAELGKLPSVYGGTGVFGTNPVCIDYKTIGADYGAADQHYTEPGRLQLFVITSTSVSAQTNLWLYPRYLDAVLDETA